MSENGKKSNDNWQRLNEVFAAALELDATEQGAFLHRSCEGDEALLSEVEKMLRAARHVQSNHFLERDAFAIGTKAISASGNEVDLAEQNIGRYKIIREIGRGGMGVVYLAEREDLRQRVALKLIKRGMDTDEILRRFRQERDLLAALNHPNIARLLDGGMTEDGLPYLVMEYVEGKPISEFCRKQNLSINERLSLFRKVCAALNYAHQNLIVHRDIKPSNILVTQDGEPKLLDFGIAKLLASDESEQTIEQTVASARLLTPEYASPEQILGEKITTASDVYSLGVLLYELLTGTRPFEFKKHNPAEIIQAICNTEPQRPSAVVSGQWSLVGDKTESKKQRTTDGGQLTSLKFKTQTSKLLRGDLDNIVLTALRKDPQRRYSSVEKFAEDVRRHLEGLPVIARPATFGYQAGKFFRRNRIAVTFASIALIVILTALSIAVWQAYVARKERARAEQRFNEVRKLANTLLTDFDEEVGDLPSSYPTRVKLARAASAYLDGLALETDDPTLMKEIAEAHFRLGEIYNSSLSDPGEAKRRYQKAAEISRRLVALTPDDLTAKNLLAKTLVTFGRERSEWEQIVREKVRLREEIVAANPPDIQTALHNLAEDYWGVGITLNDLERREESLDYCRRAVETYRRQLSLLEKKELTADEYNLKFWAYVWLGMLQGNEFNDWRVAAETSRKAIEVAEAAAARFPEDKHSQTNLHMAYNRMAVALENTSDYRGALEHYQSALRSYKDSGIRFNMFTRGSEVRYLLKTVDMLQKLGQTEQSLIKLREALAIRRQATELDRANPRSKHAHAEVFYRAENLFVAAGKFDEALAAYREAETFWTEALASNNEFRGSLAYLYLRLGDLYTNCQPDSSAIKARGATRLREARVWYQKSITSFNELQANNLATHANKENVNLAKEKLAACEARLK